jgi:peptidyl-tRNA hydrolase
MNNLKQVIIIRKDLRLKRAAVAAMAAKVSCEFLIDNNVSERGDVLKVNLTPQESDWLLGNSTRIILGVPSEDTLRSLMLKAELAGLSCYFMTGSSSKMTDGPEYDELLCAAIGPDESERIDEITGNLKLI